MFDDLNPETRGPLGLPRHGRWDPGPQHPRVRRRDARVARARPARLHPQPPGRQPPGLLEGPALAQLRLHADGTLRAAYMARLERSSTRPTAGHGRHPRPLLLRPGRAACATRRPSSGRSTRRVSWILERGLPERARGDQQRVQRRGLRPRHPAARRGIPTDRTGEAHTASADAGSWSARATGATDPEGERRPRGRFPPDARQRRERPRPHRRDGRRRAATPGYPPMPILFNEDDHFDFEKPRNNFAAATSAYASWGFFDFRARARASTRATRACR